MEKTIGELRARLTLEEEVRLTDEGGGAEGSWTEVTELWAGIRTLTGAEKFESDQISGTLTHEIEIRYRKNITPAMRFRTGEKSFFIFAVFDPTGRANRLTCLCEERDL